MQNTHAHIKERRKGMECFVHGYIGPGISIKKLLSTAECLVQRTRLGYGIVVWPDISGDPVRIRRATTWDLFFDIDRDGKAVGYAAEHFEAEGFSMDDQVQMGMVHGRYATSGALDTFPDINCHPYYMDYQGESTYYVHNGHLENHSMHYTDLSSKNFAPEANTDSATCGALLAHNILVNNMDCIKASANLVETLESTKSSGALLFTHSSELERMYAIRVNMPLIVMRSKSGCFLSSDVNILRAMDDQKVEVYCVRNGAIGWVDVNNEINLVDSKGIHTFGHYGKMYLEKRKVNKVQGMDSCLETINSGHQIEKWDKRTLTKWSIWNSEKRCLSCACELREKDQRRSMPDFELNSACPTTL